VWAAFATPSAWPSWSPQIRAVRCPDPDQPVRPGLRGTVVGPAGVALPFEVTAVDTEGRRWTWRVQVAQVAVVVAHGVAVDPREGRAGGRTCVWARITAPLPVVLTYAPLARLALARLARGVP
jgi:hypothetical protein